ncbi:MAG: M20 family metallopeptidase [Acidimicrobiales bacterium]
MTGFEIDHEGLVGFVRELVRIPSVNRSGAGEAPAAAVVVDLMQSWGWSPRVEEVAPGRPNVTCVVEGGLPGPTLMFEGHTDVVTEGDVSEWTHDPFGAEIIDGRLYGRGSADMKSGLGAMLFATRALQLAGPFPGRVLLGALCDEEEMMIGVKHFVAQGQAQGVDGVIVCEPEEGEVCAVSKGAVRLRADAHGRMAHGAMPDKGANPLVALVDLCNRLVTLQGELQAAHGEHEHLGKVFVTPTVLQGGTEEQMNVIPAEAFLGIDLRTIPGVDHDDLIKQVTSLASLAGQAHDVKVVISVVDDRPSTDTPESASVVQALVAAHETVTGHRAVFGGVPGSTDGTILWRDGGLDTVVYGPGGKWIAHQVDEYVEIAAIAEAAEVYVQAAHNFLGDN